MKLALRSLFCLFLLSAQAFAASIIRDAEIESVLRDITNPIFRVAGLTADSINIYIINDPQINAHVAGGSNIFINTGLLGMSENPNMLTGVLAHETGHISGGHLLRSSDEYKNTALKATLGYMVGLAAAAVGSPEAGVAIAQGTGHVAQRTMLQHSRTHEEEADQAALTFLDKTHQSAKGLLELLEVLYSKETTLYDDLNPYTLTHPLSRERIAHVKDHIKHSKYSEYNTPEPIRNSFARAIVKLNAFLQPYSETLKKYPDSDTSVNAHYARAIAYYKMPDIKKSLEEMAILLEKEPSNPFFNELQGQILFENGKVAESVPYYEKAVKLLPSSPLLKVILATSQIATEEESLRKKAVHNLEQGLLKEKQNSFAWHQLAIAYGRGNDLGMSNLALAEEAFLQDNKREVRKFTDLAKRYIKPGSPADLRINDLLASIEKD